jgi:hypothetical protein
LCAYRKTPYKNKFYGVFIMITKTNNKANDIMRYGMQLAMLGQLLAQGLIDSREYGRTKQTLMQDYGVTSDLTA